MLLTVAVIVLLSTVGIIAWNIKGESSPIWVKLPAPAAILVGYWFLFSLNFTEDFLLAMAVGMTAAFIGDTLLAISLKRFLLHGIALFAVGYLFFSSAIIVKYGITFSLFTLIVTLFSVIAAVMSCRKFTHSDQVLKVAVPAYYTILVTLVVSGSFISPLAASGAILLFLCDSIIAFNNFYKKIEGSDGYSLFAYNTGHFLVFYVICQKWIS